MKSYKKKNILIACTFLLTTLSLLWAFQPKTIDCLGPEGWEEHKDVHFVISTGGRVNVFRTKSGEYITNPTCHIVDWGAR